MLNQSKKELSGKLEHVTLDKHFPVSTPDFNTRTDKPDVGPHIHDHLEIGYCFDGSGIFLIGKKIFAFHTGDAVVINTHEVHIAKGNPGQTTSWGFLYLDPVKLLAETPGSYATSLKLSKYCGNGFRNIIEGDHEPCLANTIRRILLEQKEQPVGYKSMVRSLVWQMMIYLNRYYPGGGENDESCDYRDMERIVPALNYMEANFNKEMEIPYLAKLCFSSESNFRKLFHKAMGCAPLPYLVKMRLNIACAMLKHSEEGILRIACHCGYQNLSNFNRQFREAFALSPREYRKQFGMSSE